MPAASPVQEVLIRPGMVENIDPRMLPVGTPRLIQNMRVRQGARFEKRPGSAALATAGLPSTGRGCWVAAFRNLPAVTVERVSTRTRQTLYALEGDATTPSWYNFGDTSRIVPTGRTAVTGLDYTFSTNEAVTVYARGSLFVAWMGSASSTTVQVQRFSLDGIPLSPVTTIGSASNPRWVYPDSSSATVYLVTRLTSGAGTDLQIRTLDADTMAFGAGSTLAAALRTNAEIHDCAPLTNGTDWLIAYPEDATHIRVRKMTGTTSTTSTTVTTAGIPSHVGVAGTAAESICVTYLDGTATFEAHLFDSALASNGNVTVHTLTATETLARWTGAVRESQTTWRVVIGLVDTSAAPAVVVGVMRHAVVSSVAALSSGPFKVTGFVPVSKPWARTGSSGTAQVFILADNVNASATWIDQAAHFILELDSGSVTGQAHLAALSYDHIAGERRTLCQVAEIGGGRYAVAVPWVDPNQTAGVDLLSFNCALTTDSMSATHRQTCEAGDALLVSGGVLSEAVEPCSGYYISENGFAYDPLIAVAIAAGGSLTSGQIYSYKATFLFQDAAGNTHQSAPSAPVSLTPSGGNLTTTVRISTLGVSGRYGTATFLGVRVYRSWLGGPYYLANDLTFVSAHPAATTITFTDTASDAALEDNKTLYTDAKIVPTDPPSGARLVCEGGNRVFTVGWRGDVVQFSKLFVPLAPWEFSDSDSFRIFFPERITAIRYLDGALVAFSERSVFVVTGDGPDDQGNGSFSEPRRLPATAGSATPHVVETPQGLMYRSAGTIWLLPRGFGSPVPVGDAVQETLAAYPYLLSASLAANDDDECVHWLLATTDNDSGGLSNRSLVWDVRLQSWSVDTHGNFAAGGAVDGVFHWASHSWSSLSHIPVRKLSTASFLDYDASGVTYWIESKVRFGDWRPFGPIGWGTLPRVVVHGERAGTHTLKLDVSVDDKSTSTHTLTLSANTGFYAELGLPDIKGCAFGLTVYDAEGGGGGKTAGVVLCALAFEAHPFEGVKRLSGATERFT